jgi:hypothetical protein
MKVWLITISVVVIAVALRSFPNLWALVFAALFAIQLYFVRKLVETSNGLENFVARAHPIRIFATGFFVIALFGALTGLTLWGVYETLLDVWANRDIVIAETPGGGKKMPSGNYSPISLLALISTMCAFFGYVFSQVLIRGTRTLWARLQRHRG